MYCRAVLPSAGLGNKLFPWARCRAYSLEHGLPMVAPNWAQLKLGRLLRRDRDPRVYHNLFRSAPVGYMSGARSLWLRLATRRLLDEPENLHDAPRDRDAPDAVVFKGERDHFSPLTGWDVVLRQELRMLTRAGWVRRADEVGAVPIGVHVRRGDFIEASRQEDFIFRGAIRTPLEWFVRCVTASREVGGVEVPVVVVSDAPNTELDELLQLPHVTRVDTGSAIGDLLVLSTAKLLIASGGSSFSAWAAFLGQMPTVAYPGQSLAWFKITPMLGQYIGEWDHQSAIPHTLAAQINTLDRPRAGVGSR